MAGEAQKLIFDQYSERQYSIMFGKTHHIMFERTLLEISVEKKTLNNVRKGPFTGFCLKGHIALFRRALFRIR